MKTTLSFGALRSKVIARKNIRRNLNVFYCICFAMVVLPLILAGIVEFTTQKSNVVYVPISAAALLFIGLMRYLWISESKPLTKKQREDQHERSVFLAEHPTNPFASRLIGDPNGLL